MMLPRPLPYGPKQRTYVVDKTGRVLFRKNLPGLTIPVVYVPKAAYNGPPWDGESANLVVSWRTFFLVDSHRYHASPAGMKAQLDGFVWWPTMHLEVNKVQLYCIHCAGQNRVARVSAYLRSTQMPIVFARWAWDLVEITPEGENGEQGFLV